MIIVIDWNNVCKDRSKAHHLNLQGGKCYMCEWIFTSKSLNNDFRKDRDYPHLHHWSNKEQRKTVIKGVRKVLCAPCHAKIHDYKFGWMKNWIGFKYD